MALEHPPSDWVAPRLTVIVAASQRSGSHLLGELMERTGRLGVPMEYFSRFIGRDFPSLGPAMADRFRLIAEHGQTPNGVAAVKMFPPHFAELQARARIGEWLGRPRWIWLRRRDMLAQAISFVIALQTDAFLASHAPKAEPHYDGAEILRRMGHLVGFEAQWRSYFARTGIEPLSLFYEDVVADPGTAVESIAALAGVTLDPDMTHLAERHVRQAGPRNAQWRERFLAEYGDAERIDWPAPAKAPARRQAAPSLLRRVRRRLGL